jgi:hypothetical protein
MAAQGVSVENHRLPIGRRPVRASRADQAEADLFVESPGGAKMVGYLEHEVMLVRRGPLDRLPQQCERDPLPSDRRTVS